MTDDRTPLLRQATMDDLPTVFAVLNDAAAWLREKGIDQWPAHFDRRGWRGERIGGYVDAGWVWLASDVRGAVAVITLSPDADPDFAHGWPDGPGDALYIYRMATVRRARGQDIGARLVAWANDRAAQQGQQWLRLDCFRTNTRLHAYYERLGFQRVGTVEHATRRSGALFQRPVTRPQHRRPLQELPAPEFLGQ
jgi:GNAT superfamily N-acetyltransferase